MPRAPKRTDNVTFVKELMNFSKFGALSEIFVIDALAKWSEIIANSDPAKLETPMISGEAWIGVAKEIKAKLDERLA
ncbi:hypothetical protein [Bradyrhizobium sp. SZCCHNS3053]|uniref:hypothetical protein n=1 Tax=Bradyrhizobium sp. SZCCHNS3053 TaxID=3057322 RepID=UPI002916739D|nr:hypothetical protein [Bradyrhizobium sp. SZCCHNS3053]